MRTFFVDNWYGQKRYFLAETPEEVIQQIRKEIDEDGYCPWSWEEYEAGISSKINEELIDFSYLLENSRFAEIEEERNEYQEYLKNKYWK